MIKKELVKHLDENDENISEIILEFIYEECILCKKKINNESRICKKCIKRVKYNDQIEVIYYYLIEITRIFIYMIIIILLIILIYYTK